MMNKRALIVGVITLIFAVGCSRADAEYIQSNENLITSEQAFSSNIPNPTKSTTQLNEASFSPAPSVSVETAAPNISRKIGISQDDYCVNVGETTFSLFMNMEEVGTIVKNNGFALREITDAFYVVDAAIIYRDESDINWLQVIAEKNGISLDVSPNGSIAITHDVAMYVDEQATVYRIRLGSPFDMTARGFARGDTVETMISLYGADYEKEVIETHGKGMYTNYLYTNGDVIVAIGFADDEIGCYNVDIYDADAHPIYD